MPAATTVTLKKDLARAVRSGHPWIFRDALAAGGGRHADGAVVLVANRAGARPARLGWGFWDAASPIAVRLLERGADAAPPDRDGVRALVVERLRAALAFRLGQLDLGQTNAFRWVHGEADDLPGIHVDVYGDVAAVRYDGAGARAFYAGHLTDWLHAAAGEFPLRAVVDREHRGAAGSLEVREHGLRFAVDLGRGQKGGLFLDQRDNRALVRRYARHARVLNLFAYTGGFSVHAAAAGARSTDTVDIAKGAIAAARDNFARNGLSLEGAGFHAVDAFAFLERAAQEGRRWDLVICDPPSFAPRQSALAAARAAYRKLHRLAAAVVEPGGVLAAASCSSHLPAAEFLALVRQGVRDAGRRHTLIEQRGAGFDHPVRPHFPEGDYLKFTLGRLS